ncbi:hypothetical protein FNYG_02456 [Fusarium nygamai]|uniref:Uncharacterized protein n=1 Tax=Gibberella nygamai TaxID=42673 RepID=A0A2K0WNB9_GIBNY|nr:hypothetical protein FNYG_02456 [Fusarium nygamai]
MRRFPSPGIMQRLKARKAIFEITVKFGNVGLGVQERMTDALAGKPAGLAPYHFLISTLVGERVIKIAELRAEVLH